MRIVIIGSGVVGTATGQGFAHHGHPVTFVDADARRVDALRRQGHDAAGEPDLRGPAAVVMVCVPTPADEAGYDLAILGEAIDTVAAAAAGAGEMPTVVIRSTVPPGTLDGVVVPALEAGTGRRLDDGFAAASNPEFLRAAHALDDVLAPWMTVVASRSAVTRDLLAGLLRPFGGTLRVLDDPVAAELAKVAHNVYNATKISFFNELHAVAGALGVDPAAVAETVAHSAEASWNPDYGIVGGRAFAGACLPKDLDGYVALARRLGLPATQAAATRTVNRALAGSEPVVDLRDGDADRTGGRAGPTSSRGS
jgi:UDPglucose 6-dehydrogenase